jgi:trigger factor
MAIFQPSLSVLRGGDKIPRRCRIGVFPTRDADDEGRRRRDKGTNFHSRSEALERFENESYAAASFEIPRALLDAEIGRMQQAAIEDLKQRGMTTQNLSLPADLFAERATRRIKLSILVSDLVKRHGLEPRPEQVRKLIEEHAESYEQPDQLVRWYYGDPSRLAEFEALAMEDNVVEWAMKKMKVEDKPTEFDELMGTKKG